MPQKNSGGTMIVFGVIALIALIIVLIIKYTSSGLSAISDAGIIILLTSVSTFYLTRGFMLRNSSKK